MSTRLAQRRRKATVQVTEETLKQALTEARALVQRVGHDDPRAAELKQLYNDISGILHSETENLSDLFDDAVNPDTANELKAAVDRIAQIKNAISQPSEQTTPIAEPVDMAESNAYAGAPAEVLRGREQFASVENVKSKGAPMSSRLFARKKKVIEAEDEMLDAAPEAVAGDAPTEPLLDEGAPMEEGIGPATGAPAAPAAATPPTAGNPFANLPTELLSAWVEAATKVENFSSNPAILGAIENVSEELKNRPMQPEPVEGAPKAASVKEAKAPAGWEGTVKEMKKDKDVDNPYALANWMKDEGYTPHKASFLFRRRGGKYWQEKFAAVSQTPPVNEDTLNKVDGQPHEVPEIGEAHGDREGVEKAEKHDSHPGTSGTEIKSPQDMEKQAGADSEISKALKTAEQIEKKLGELYMDAKPVCRANASAAVRDAVESIYDAKNKFAEAKKVLNKHEMQANAEKEAQDAALKKDKKASIKASFGLELAAVE
jgi:hypothetical protein